MAEDLNGYLSSVFTREDISSLPVPDAKFQEAKSDYLGQLIVTPEMVAKKIKAMKDNKFHGVDGIPPKLLMETVEQIRIAPAKVVIKKREWFLLNGKKQTSYNYLKRVREISQSNSDQ